LIVALLGFVGGYFFLNFISHGTPFALFSAGTLPLSNIAIGLKVSASLYGVFVALAIFGKVIVGGDQNKGKGSRGKSSDVKEHKG
jgi:hypothetical protein